MFVTKSSSNAFERNALKMFLAKNAFKGMFVRNALSFVPVRNASTYVYKWKETKDMFVTIKRCI
jgi:hypothetical protein